jgi:hypothetical protein
MLRLDDEHVNESILERLQSRLKISKASHKRIATSIERQVKESVPLGKFKLEFDSNVKDAVADGDTLLRFQFTNLSESEQLKVSIYWDDPEAPDELDFRIASRGFVKPGSREVLMQTHIFRRAGRKSIQGVEIHVSNLFQDSAKFLVSPFEFSVSSPTQTIVQHTTTNTNISIEGRGVVDASGVGARSKSDESPAASWDRLIHTLKIESLFGKVDEHKGLEALASTLEISEPYKYPVKDSSNTKADADTNSNAVEQQPPLNRETGGEVDRPVASITSAGYEVSEAHETSPLRAKIEAFLYALSEINVAEGGAVKRVVSSAEWSLSLVRKLATEIPDCGEDLIVGAVFSDPIALRLGTRNNLESFDGDATVLTEKGISIVNSRARSVKLVSDLSWADADDYGIDVYSKRFGPLSFILEFGDPEAKVPFPGCQFDLRQYRGKPSSNELLDVSRKVFTDICSLCDRSGIDAQEIILNDDGDSSTFVDKASDLTPLPESHLRAIDPQNEVNATDVQGSEYQDEHLNEQQAERFFVNDLSPQLLLLDEKLVRFFQLFGFCMQGCIESSPRSVFTRQTVDPSLWHSIYSSLEYRGYPLFALCLEPHRALVSQEGRLSGWVGSASGLSVEGIFHLVKDEVSEFKADGENYFLPWSTFFGSLKASIFIREVGPDVWLGAPAKFFIQGTYKDYSDNVVQWDYFQEFIKRELIETFDEIKRFFV